MSGRRSVRLTYYQRTKLGKESSAREIALKIFLLSIFYLFLSIRVGGNKIKTREEKKRGGGGDRNENWTFCLLF